MKFLRFIKHIIFFFFLLVICPLQASEISQDKNQEYPLTLQETTRLALTNNFDIQLARYDAWIQQTARDKAFAIYDTVIDAEVAYQNNQRKQASTILGTRTMDNHYNVGISKKLSSGTTLRLSLENHRSVTNSSFSALPVVHDSTLGVSITQDLGKNFFGMNDRGEIQITVLDIENTTYSSLNKIEQVVADVQKAYWELRQQHRHVQITKDMVEQAKRLYQFHQEKLKDGLIEKPEAIASEANYKKRQDELVLAQNTLAQKNNRLKFLLNITERHVFIKPLDSFQQQDSELSLQFFLKKAFTYRRDYKQAVNRIKAKDIDLRMKKNKTWPEINLTATFQKNGLGDHFKQALRQVTDEDHSNVMAGLTIVFPLQNREARSEVKSAELAKAKEILAMKRLERQITVEIVDKVRDCNLFLSLAKSAQRIARLQAQKLEAEEKRFNQGRSDTDTLIRFQEDLARARVEAVRAQYRYQAALIDLHQHSGILLQPYWKATF